MIKKKKSSSLFSDSDQEKVCVQYLKERGYVAFKATEISLVDEEEAVNKLRAVGYKVEHRREALVKIDATRIRDVDDIAVYFHEMMKRHNPRRHNPKRLRDKKLRLVDHSVINFFISWRVEEGSSVADAIEDMFLLIDTLFEKAEEWKIDIRGIGILSVNSNKPFVLALMNEVRMKKDTRLNFEVASLLGTEDKQNYMAILLDAKGRMDAVGRDTRPPAIRRAVRLKD